MLPPFHRKPARRPRSDVYANVEEGLVLRQAPSQLSVALEEHAYLRTAAPANKPLRRTMTWLATLPPGVQPTALLRHFARIANLISATWGKPKVFDTYMESLLNDKRGNRRGFPPEVLSDLITLQRYYDTKDQNSI
jgi:hypothetical protein